jgi:Trypsin-co-occurring domain 2
MGEKPRGVVGLSEALIALRAELMEAWWDGEGNDQRLRFKIAEPIQLTIEAAVTTDVEGHAGVKWWLLDVGGGASRSAVSTHTLQLKLAPVMYDPQTGERIDEVEIDRELEDEP